MNSNMEIILYDRLWRTEREREVRAREGGLNASAKNFPCLLLMASLLKMTLPQFHQVTVSRAVYHVCVYVCISLCLHFTVWAKERECVCVSVCVFHHSVPEARLIQSITTKTCATFICVPTESATLWTLFWTPKWKNSRKKICTIDFTDELRLWLTIGKDNKWLKETIKHLTHTFNIV